LFGPACFRAAMTVQLISLLALAALLSGEELSGAVQPAGNRRSVSSAAAIERQSFAARRVPQSDILSYPPQFNQPLADVGPQ